MIITPLRQPCPHQGRGSVAMSLNCRHGDYLHGCVPSIWHHRDRGKPWRRINNRENFKKKHGNAPPCPARGPDEGISHICNFHGLGVNFSFMPVSPEHFLKKNSPALLENTYIHISGNAAFIQSSPEHSSKTVNLIIVNIQRRCRQTGLHALSSLLSVHVCWIRQAGQASHPAHTP